MSSEHIYIAPLRLDEKIMEFQLMRLDFADVQQAPATSDKAQQGTVDPDKAPHGNATFGKAPQGNTSSDKPQSPSRPSFSLMRSFFMSGTVMNIFLLDPAARLLSGFVWIHATNSIGLFVLLDWDEDEYVFVDTSLPCVSLFFRVCGS